jgi:hypothetical protein
MPIEVINLITQGALAAVFFYLYWTTNQRLQEQDERHDQDMKHLYSMWVTDLKYIANLPTDLEGKYTMPPKVAS